ncbi:MAG: glycosyltransferase family 2 protein [Acidobacteria bacterium]|nr:MAG: glycosyltransferase family 2 protein [Acidobacteriota bacterium]
MTPSDRPSFTSSPHRPGVSIVIPTWNGRHLLERGLPSVMEAAQAYAQEKSTAVEVIVVDDGSTDGTTDWLRAAYPHITTVRKEVNEGFASTSNAGFARVASPITVLLNNDVGVRRDFLSYLVPHFSDPTVFAVCCKALDAETHTVITAGKIGEFKRGFWRVFGNYDVVEATMSHGQTLSPDIQCYSILASGGFSAFSTEKVRELGGFNQFLDPFYWEDVDLSLRAWKRGWKILYEPRAIVYHATSSTIGTHFDRRQITMIAQRNRLITHWINLHDPIWVMEHIGMVALLILSSLLTLNLPFLRALAAAVRLLPHIRERRRVERRAIRLSDRELARLMAFVRQQPGLRILNR